MVRGLTDVLPTSVHTIPTSVVTNAGQSTVPAGLSSVADSLSTQGSQNQGSVFKTVSYPFVAVVKFFSDAISGMLRMLSSMFGFGPSAADRAAVEFIDANLANFNDDAILQEALDKFSEIRDPAEQLFAFSHIQADPSISAEVTRAFYDLIKVDTQNHVERHIWKENSRNDAGLGMAYGKNIINTDIKSDVLKDAITACLTEKH